MESKKIFYNEAEYTVFEDGTVYNSRGKKLKQHTNRDGYLVVSLRDKNVLVHRLVAIAFVPNPHGYPVVDHLDSNRSNPHASNLEWVTTAENNRRAAAKGVRRGEKNPSAKLTEEDVKRIKLDAKNLGLNARQILENTIFQCLNEV